MGSTTTVQVHLPTPLVEEASALIRAGLYQSLDDVLVEAFRRFLESRRPELVEHFAKADVEWGLRGED